MPELEDSKTVDQKATWSMVWPAVARSWAMLPCEWVSLEVHGSTREEATDDVDFLLPEFECWKYNMLEYFFQAVFPLCRTLNITVCTNSFGHRLSFFCGYLFFYAAPKIYLCAYKYNWSSAFSVSLYLRDPGVTYAGEWAPVSHGETQNENFAFFVSVCSQVFKITLWKK